MSCSAKNSSPRIDLILISFITLISEFTVSEKLLEVLDGLSNDLARSSAVAEGASFFPL